MVIESRRGQRDAEETLHVGEGVHGDAGLADLPGRQRVVRIAAVEGRVVESDGKARLALVQEEAVPGVGLVRRAHAGELPHGPHLPPVHGGVHAPRERVVPGVTEPRIGIEFPQVLRRVEGLERPSRQR
jgi:hypothetical protein